MSQENVEIVTQVAVTAGPVQRVDVRAHTWMAAGVSGLPSRQRVDGVDADEAVVLPECAGRDVGLVVSGRIEGLGFDEGDVVAARASRTCSRSVAPTPWFRWSRRTAIQRISAARDDRYSTTAKPTTPSFLVMTQPWCASRSLAIYVGTSSVKKSGSPRTIVWHASRSSGAMGRTRMAVHCRSSESNPDCSIGSPMSLAGAWRDFSVGARP